MTKEEYISLLSKDIAGIISDNRENIYQGITEALNKEEPLSMHDFSLLERSISIAVQLSCQIVFDELCERGILEPEKLSQRQRRTDPLLTGGCSVKKYDQ